MSFFEKLFGSFSDKELKRINPLKDKVLALEPEMAKLTDDELKAKTTECKERLAKGETLDQLLPEAFAAPALQKGEIGRLTLAETIPPRQLLMARRSGQALSIAALPRHPHGQLPTLLPPRQHGSAHILVEGLFAVKDQQGFGGGHLRVSPGSRCLKDVDL